MTLESVASRSSRFHLLRFALSALCLSSQLACESDEAARSTLDSGASWSPEAGLTDAANVIVDSPPDGLPSFCTRAGDDAVRDIFCADADAGVTSLRALQDRLGVSPLPPGVAPTFDAGALLDSNQLQNQVVFLGHSTALAAQQVSPINPRVILIGTDTLLAFQRGTQQVELATRARDKQGFDFYLLSFSQACNQRTTGCRPGDLYTPRIEADWRKVSVDDDEALKNTPSDCRQCHQRGLTRPILLMRELEGPWTHFFGYDPESSYGYPGPVAGRDLSHDLRTARGEEAYAGLPAQVARYTVGFVLQNLVDNPQPLVFDVPAIDMETNRDYFDAGVALPLRSPTWDRAYQAFQRGEQLALPHFTFRPTDFDKQTRLSEAYQRYLGGELSADELPDLADIYPDDPTLRAEIGLQNVPGATPAESLVQTCGSCHNDVLDQTLSRARFNVALSRMSRSELDVAIARLQLARDMPGAMPPPGNRQLDSDALSALLTYLRANVRAADDDTLLERAASLGMAGGQRQ